jgi:hypothetical protein
MKVNRLVSDKERLTTGKEFHFKEYDSLKKEIVDLVEHSRKLEIYALGGIAAFYAWWFLRATAAPPVARAALLLPILIVFLGGLRSFAVLLRIKQLGTYLVDVETTFALAGLGWESRRVELRRLADKDAGLKRLWRSLQSIGPFLTTGLLYWAILLFVTTAALMVLGIPKVRYWLEGVLGFSL